MRHSSRRGLEAMRRALVATTSALLVASGIAVAGVAQSAPAQAVSGVAPAQAAAGAPGVPGDPAILYEEDFENAGAFTLLRDYAASWPVSYSASSYYLNTARCNGFVVRANASDTRPSSAICNGSDNNWRDVLAKAEALGVLSGTQATNAAVSSNTSGRASSSGYSPDGTIEPNQVQFESTQLSLPAVDRYVTFSVDAAASACRLAQPLLRFYLRDAAGTEIPVSDSAINPCTDPRGTSGSFRGQTVAYGSFPANSSELFAGGTMGIVMRNETGQTFGNDGAFDNVRVLDVTPQLDKSFGTQSIGLGQTTSLTFTITNTSELAAKRGWTFTDVLPDGMTVADGAASTTCSSGEVAAAQGASSITASGDLDSGQESCTVTVNVITDATGSFTNGPDNVETTGLNPPGETTVVVSNEPSLALVKSADSAAQDGFVLGQEISYSFLATNTGNVTLTDLSINDVDFSGSGDLSAINCPVTTLTPGQDATCTASYTVVQADVEAGSIENTATATGTPPGGLAPIDSPPSSVSLTGPGTPAAPGLSVVKSAEPVGAESYRAGDVITYSFVVTNTGNVTLMDVAPVEGEFTGSGELGEISPAAVESLAPGQQATFTAEYVLTQADVDAGSVRNTATATGTPPGGEPVESPPSSFEVVTPAAPGLSVVKSAEPVGAESYRAGDVITYSFVVTNTGNVTLMDVAPVEGEFTGSGELGEISPAAVESLAPGQQATFTAEYVLTQADVDAGSVRNTATATGTPPGGEPVESPPSSFEVVTPAAPGLSVVKSAEPVGAESYRAGDVITYSFVVTNTGNVTLMDVAPVEGEFTGSGELGEISPAAVESLAPGQQATFTAEYVLTQADVDAGSVRNTATATGTPPGGEPVESPPSSFEVFTPAAPGLSVVKSAEPVGAESYRAGDVITYSFVVTNTGNVTLMDVAPVEGEFTGSGELGEISPAAVESLAPGQQATFTAEYVLTQADVDAGSVRNTATATGTPPGGEPVESPPSSFEVFTPAAPGLSVVKSAEPVGAESYRAGDVITYSFVVTNTGNVTLMDVAPVEGEFTGSGELGEISPAAVESLAPGQQATFTAEYVLTQADVDAGSVRNTATATGTPPGGEPVESPPSSFEVVTPAAPGLSVVKSAEPVGAESYRAGDVITYSFVVTNTGNVTLMDVAPVEGEFTGSGELGEISPAAVESLAPGQQATFTAEYVLTQADVDAGSVRNTATATGTPPGGEPVESPPSSFEVVTPAAPGLSVVKSAEPVGAESYRAGDVITYSFVVTNTGNVTLMDVAPVEGEFTGSGELGEISPAAVESLAPGQQATFTAEYVLTQADVDAGSVRNTATATGTPPGGEPVESPPSSFEVVTPAAPGLSVVKSADREEVTRAGDVITYSFVVTNTGNVTLMGVAPVEGEFTGSGELGEISPAAVESLAPGQQATFTVEYEVTAADLTGDSLSNTAIAQGTPPSGGVIDAPSSTEEVSTVPPPSSPSLPQTGTDGAISWAIVSLFALLVGGLLLAVRRREQSRSTTALAADSVARKRELP